MTRSRAPAKKKPTLVGLLEHNSIQSVKTNQEGALLITFDGNFDTDYEDVDVVINGTDGCGIAAAITTKSDLKVS